LTGGAHHGPFGIENCGPVAATLHSERGTAHEMLAEAADAASGSAQTRTCAGPPFGPVNAEIHDVNVAVSPRSRRNRDRIHPTVASPDHLEPRRTATSTQPPANRAATFAKQTEAIKRLEQKRMLPRFSLRFVFVLKWSAIYASSTVATYQDGAALGFSMFFPWGSR
jgi:hypothetical protein